MNIHCVNQAERKYYPYDCGYFILATDSGDQLVCVHNGFYICTVYIRCNKKLCFYVSCACFCSLTLINIPSNWNFDCVAYHDHPVSPVLFVTISNRRNLGNPSFDIWNIQNSIFVFCLVNSPRIIELLLTICQTTICYLFFYLFEISITGIYNRWEQYSFHSISSEPCYCYKYFITS